MSHYSGIKTAWSESFSMQKIYDLYEIIQI